MPPYQMDSFHLIPQEPTGVRKVSQQIEASSDDDAIREAQRVAAEQKPHHYVLLAIGSLADRVIHAGSES
ncbi:MAG TPA: hypothetical protein VLC74_02560 [Rhizomicrobium sp.]|nr:hypothetical protein [Rhizomicrobium sp.]